PEGAAGLPDGGFDLAVCFDAPAGRAAEGLVAEAARLLADRGLLLLSVDAGSAPSPDPATNGHEPTGATATAATRLERPPRRRVERDDALARAGRAAEAQEQIVAKLREEVVAAQARGLRIADGLRRQIEGLTRQLQGERERAGFFEKRYHIVIGSRGWRAL